MNCSVRNSRVNRPEDAGANRLQLAVEKNGGITIEIDGGAIRAANTVSGTNNDRVIDFALLYATTRGRFFDSHLDDVTDVGVTALRAAQHLDTHH